MTTRSLTRLPAALALLALAASTLGAKGCAKDAGPGPSTPTIASVAPGHPASSPQPQTLTVTGRMFMPFLTLTVQAPDGTTQQFNGSKIEDAGNTSFHVSVLLNQVGAYVLTITNFDGGVAPPFTLDVSASD